VVLIELDTFAESEIVLLMDIVFVDVLLIDSLREEVILEVFVFVSLAGADGLGV